MRLGYKLGEKEDIRASVVPRAHAVVHDPKQSSVGDNNRASREERGRERERCCPGRENGREKAKTGRKRIERKEKDTPRRRRMKENEGKFVNDRGLGSRVGARARDRANV